MPNDPNKPERPRFEPEIIPPDRSGGPYPGRPYIFIRSGGTQRIYTGRLGPFSVTLAMLLVALVVVAVFFTVVSAVLIWLPIVLLIAAAAAIYRYFFMRRG